MHHTDKNQSQNHVRKSTPPPTFASSPPKSPSPPTEVATSPISPTPPTLHNPPEGKTRKKRGEGKVIPGASPIPPPALAQLFREYLTATEHLDKLEEQVKRSHASRAKIVEKIALGAPPDKRTFILKNGKIFTLMHRQDDEGNRIYLLRATDDHAVIDD
jgi:hypothetical protein